jgi:ubiquinol-cytochrome c reductase cytochrome b subunit
LVLFLFPVVSSFCNRGYFYSFMHQVLFWTWVRDILMLLWIGARPVEEPYITIGGYCTFYYFLFFFLTPLVSIRYKKLFNEQDEREYLTEAKTVKKALVVT